jgi:hypothetical protein
MYSPNDRMQQEIVERQFVVTRKKKKTEFHGHKEDPEHGKAEKEKKSKPHRPAEDVEGGVEKEILKLITPRAGPKRTASDPASSSE